MWFRREPKHRFSELTKWFIISTLIVIGVLIALALAIDLFPATPCSCHSPFGTPTP